MDCQTLQKIDFSSRQAIIAASWLYPGPGDAHLLLSWLFFYPFKVLVKKCKSDTLTTRPLAEEWKTSYISSLCQGSKWLNGKSVWLVIRRSWVWISAWSWNFSFLALSAKNINIHNAYCHTYTVNNIKPLNDNYFMVCVFLPSGQWDYYAGGRIIQCVAMTTVHCTVR